jgi:threonine dehydrogenase-like Zn-dependent dehydrogenase
MLSAQELERYARHIVLHEIGGPGQQALKRARVLVIGAGGLGAPALLYLAAAGVGTLGVIDDDAVALSNLQRQVIHGTPEIGEPKVESAAAAIRRLNPHVTVETHAARLAAANALALIAGYDVVADGSDNFATRYLVADACFFAKKPLVTAAVGIFDGTLTQPDLPLPFPRAVAARHGPDLRGGRHPRRAHRRARLADGARSDPGNRRLRRGARRAAAHVRRPRHALRDPAIRLGPVQPALGRASHDQGFIASRLIVL